eukprot:sb/3467848/
MSQNGDEVCRRIIDGEANPYQCFGLPVRWIEPATVRNMYLKIAVKVHPDKNSSTLATKAFQVLSESFERLHDEEEQRTLLSSLKSGGGGSKRKKKKEKDVADLVRQTSSWWRKDWEEVESEISRMTNEFKEHLARKQEKHERQREKKMERRERKNKRIKRNLDYLKEKYGISSSDSSDSEDNNQIQGSSSSTVMAEISRKELEQKEEEKEEEKICWLCERSFQSGKLLQVHREKSQLHKDNLAKQEEQNNASAAAEAAAAPSGSGSGSSKGGFKNTFSTVT